MDISFEKSNKNETTDEWITPPTIMRALGEFDLDPCSSVFQAQLYAKKNYTKNDMGLMQDWFGRVWCNPPYSDAEPWLKKMSSHNNGIALVFGRTDTVVWHEHIFPNATAFLFVRGRISFLREGEVEESGAGAASVFIAFGEQNAKILQTCGIAGSYIEPQKRIIIQKRLSFEGTG